MLPALFRLNVSAKADLSACGEYWCASFFTQASQHGVSIRVDIFSDGKVNIPISNFISTHLKFMKLFQGNLLTERSLLVMFK
jgi:hypothetical protein